MASRCPRDLRPNAGDFPEGLSQGRLNMYVGFLIHKMGMPQSLFRLHGNFIERITEENRCEALVRAHDGTQRAESLLWLSYHLFAGFFSAFGLKIA